MGKHKKRRGDHRWAERYGGKMTMIEYMESKGNIIPNEKLPITHPSIKNHNKAKKK